MRLAITGLLACVAFGQSPGEQSLDRVFYLTHATERDLQEIAVVVRRTADIGQVSIDAAQRTLALRGTPSQLAMGEWLIHELDGSASRQPGMKREYRAPGGGDDVARVFYLTHAGTPERLQEIAASIRRGARIQRLFLNNARSALAMRGTAGQMAVAERMVKEQDRP